MQGRFFCVPCAIRPNPASGRHFHPSSLRMTDSPDARLPAPPRFRRHPARQQPALYGMLHVQPFPVRKTALRPGHATASRKQPSGRYAPSPQHSAPTQEKIKLYRTKSGTPTTQGECPHRMKGWTPTTQEAIPPPHEETARRQRKGAEAARRTAGRQVR